MADLPSLPSGALDQVNMCTAEFGGFATNVSSTCDIMGTISGLATEVAHDVIDAVTGAVTTVRQAVGDVVASMKEKMSDIFSGGGSVLNTVKGYVAKAQEIAAKIAAKAGQISESIMATMRSIMNSIGDGISYVMGVVRGAFSAVGDAIGAVRDGLLNVVQGVKVATCSAINSVLAGTPDNAFANITNGSTDPATINVGAAKDVFNTGADSVMEVTNKITESSGIGNTINNSQNAIAGAGISVAGTAGSVSAINVQLNQLDSMVGAIA